MYPQDYVLKDYVSVHIKRQSAGGWTDRLIRYFEAMNPSGHYPFVLTHINDKVCELKVIMSASYSYFISLLARPPTIQRLYYSAFEAAEFYS